LALLSAGKAPEVSLSACIRKQWVSALWGNRKYAKGTGMSPLTHQRPFTGTSSSNVHPKQPRLIIAAFTIALTLDSPRTARRDDLLRWGARSASTKFKIEC